MTATLHSKVYPIIFWKVGDAWIFPQEQGLAAQDEFYPVSFPKILFHAGDLHPSPDHSEVNEQS